MFRPCWVIFRENSLLHCWIHLYSYVRMCLCLGTFSRNCISASNGVTDYSPWRWPSRVETCRRFLKIKISCISCWILFYMIQCTDMEHIKFGFLYCPICASLDDILNTSFDFFYCWYCYYWCCCYCCSHCCLYLILYECVLNAEHLKCSHKKIQSGCIFVCFYLNSYLSYSLLDCFALEDGADNLFRNVGN
jgi:hypothetical protein